MQTLELLFKGISVDIYILPEVLKKLAKDFKGDKRSLIAINAKLKVYSNHGEEVFIEPTFKHVGKFSRGLPCGTDVSVYSIRHNQVRLYGCKGKNGSIFICTASDKKQQNKAKKIILEMAAKKFSAITDIELKETSK